MRPAKPKPLFTLLVLLGINTMNFYDRQVLGAVAEPVREDLGINDKGLGLLTTVFVLLYAAVGVPLGRWADLGRRTRLLAGGVAVWSVFTALSGAAWNFAAMIAFRLGVGVGEASCAPTANSLLGDLFPRERRGRALGVFMIGLPLGLALSSVVSGYLAHLWHWRAAFFVAGLPGLVLGLLCLFIPEPSRGAADHHGAAAVRPSGNPLPALLGIPTLWWIILSGALHNFNMYAIGAFLSPYAQRYHHVSISTAGLISGIAYGCGGLGVFLGGWACDWAMRRRVGGRLEVCTLALLVVQPCIILAFRQPPGAVLAFTLWLLPACLFLYVYYAGVYATIQDVVEPGLRGTAMAVYFFVMYLWAALGPLLTGWVSDYFAGRSAAADGAGAVADWHRAVGLHDALALVLPVHGIALVVVLFLASRTVYGDYRKLQERLGAEAVKV